MSFSRTYTKAMPTAAGDVASALVAQARADHKEAVAQGWAGTTWHRVGNQHASTVMFSTSYKSGGHPVSVSMRITANRHTGAAHVQFAQTTPKGDLQGSIEVTPRGATSELRLEVASTIEGWTTAQCDQMYQGEFARIRAAARTAASTRRAARGRGELSA